MLAHIEHSTEPADLVMALSPDPDTPVLNDLLAESEVDFADLTTGWPHAARNTAEPIVRAADEPSGD